MYKIILSLTASSMGLALTDFAAKDTARIYGERNIRRAIQQARKGRRYEAPGSLAGKPHKHRREIARRTTRPGTPERKAAYEAARRG